MAYGGPESACRAGNTASLQGENGAGGPLVPAPAFVVERRARACASHPVTTLGAVLTLVAHGRPAREALVEIVERLRAPDPLAPVTVAVPSPLAGLALRRFVGARTGFANVHFTALARVAELLGAPMLSGPGRRPLTPAARIEAVHAVLAADTGGPFAAVAGHLATAVALATIFDELRALSDDARGAVASRGERPAAIIRLFDAYQAQIADCYDAEDVAFAAATAVAADAAAAAEVGQVVLHLPLALSPGEEALLRALAERSRLNVLLGTTGDAIVDDAHVGALAERLTEMLGAPTRSTAPSAPTAQRIVSAPDPEDEVRAVARELDERARRGEPLGRIAVLYRIAEPYARLVPEVLDAAGIPWTGAQPRRVADSAAGRILLGFLALPDDDLARDDVAAWLASGPVVDPATGHRVNAARWDVLSREGGVVRGAGQWDARLTRSCAAVEDELKSTRAGLEASEWQLERLERSRVELRALQAFVADLATSLTPPADTTWRAFTTWAQAALTRFAGGSTYERGWPEHEVDAAARVDAVLEELGSLDAVGTSVDLVRFRRALTTELDAQVGRVGRFGEGALVASLGQAFAGDFDTVYILGAIEGALPPRGHDDPLLPDRDRRAIAGLELHAARRVEERRDYLAALSSGTERVLLFPRADARAQRRRLPAQWVLESARASSDEQLTAERLRDHSTTPWLTVVESFDRLVAHGEPASPTEYALQALRAWQESGRPLEEHPLAAGELARGFRSARARFAEGSSAFDGFVGPSPDLAPGIGGPTSPTAMQDWASCPFRYFLGRVLRLRDVPRPEATESISAVDAGSLIHAVLEEFVRDSPPLSGPDARWSNDDRARLDGIVNRHCDQAVARGITGRKVPWILERRRIVATASRFLATDEHTRARLGVVPAPDGLERAFGADGEEPVDLELGDGRVVRFRGRIDRIDRSPDGRRTVVYDYKTGRVPDSDDDPVSAGRALQLPVYALAARAREGTDDATACYWYTRVEDPDDALVEISLDATEDRFVDVVTTIVDGISGGCFPAYPGEPTWDHRSRSDSWDMCKYCDFDRLCPVDRGRAWERVRDDPATAPFLALGLEAEETDGEHDDEGGAA
jgi:RecB family exonuclease